MINRKLCVGLITAPHGVRGQVRVKSFTTAPADITLYGPLTDVSGERVFQLEVVGLAKGVLLARIEGVRDRHGAETLRGTELFLERDAFPETDDEDEFYHADLVGLTATLPDGRAYGTVRALHDFGAGDMIEFELADSGDVILPFTRKVVPEIDLERGRMVVEPPNILGDSEAGDNEVAG